MHQVLFQLYFLVKIPYLATILNPEKLAVFKQLKTDNIMAKPIDNLQA